MNDRNITPEQQRSEELRARLLAQNPNSPSYRYYKAKAMQERLKDHDPYARKQVLDLYQRALDEEGRKYNISQQKTVKLDNADKETRELPASSGKLKDGEMPDWMKKIEARHFYGDRSGKQPPKLNLPTQEKDSSTFPRGYANAPRVTQPLPENRQERAKIAYNEATKK